MRCVAVTPERTVFDEEVDFVVLPLYDGEYGIAKGHSPIVGRLGVGELRLLFADKSVGRWYIEGGFVEVVNDVVSLLTNRARGFEELEVVAADRELAEALALPSSGFEEANFKIEAVERARAKLRVARKAETIVRK